MPSTEPYVTRLTPKQIQQMIDIAEEQARLSIERRCNQEVTFVFKNGHIEFVNASNNQRATTEDLVMDEGYQWRKP